MSDHEHDHDHDHVDNQIAAAAKNTEEEEEAAINSIEGTTTGASTSGTGGIIGFVAFRSGSKRLPKKNGMKLGNKTLYEITLDKLVRLKKLGQLDAVVASTDNIEWQQHCQEVYGDQVIIHDRPESVSTDSSNMGHVVMDFLQQQHPEFRQHAVLVLLCVYPFLKMSVLENVIQKYHATKTPVYAIVESHHMPQKLLRIEDRDEEGDGETTGVLRPYLFDNMDEYQENTKLLVAKYPKCVHTTGIYLFGPNAYERLLSKGDLWHHDDIHYVYDDSFHVDIDNYEDFELAKLRYEQTKMYE